MLPRIDVGYSGFVAAIVALLLLAFNYVSGLPVDPAIIGPAAVVIFVFLAGYFYVPAKEVASTLAAALIVLVQAYFSIRQGAPVDTALVVTALTALTNVILVWALPRIQPQGP